MLPFFTCSTSRAIHLELVPDMSTETFLLCFKRFVSRRGIPSLVVTDNAKKFKSASKKLIALFKSAKVQAYLTEKRIKSKYNQAKAPWWGGFYERLIKSVKSCLKKCVGRASLSFDELHTTLVEIEGVLNLRPLTYLYSDDLEEPLTPSHLILGRRILKLPEFEEDEEDDKDFDDNPDTALRRLRYLSTVLKHYWQRWKAEYLVDLCEFHKMRKGQKGLPVDIKEGDIVSVQDEGRHNRILWRLGRVTKLIKGRDNVIRGAKIVLANKQWIERPVEKLYPLEVSANKLQPTLKDPSIDKSELKSDRPKRAAAVIASERINIIDQLESLP